jgi:hypothetical protein
MPNQGFYSLRKELAFDGGSWPKGALVQLGYTRIGEPILFIAQQRGQMAENDLFFAESGVKVGNDKLAQLEPLTVFIEQGGHAAADNGLETPSPPAPLPKWERGAERRESALNRTVERRSAPVSPRGRGAGGEGSAALSPSAP